MSLEKLENKINERTVKVDLTKYIPSTATLEEAKGIDEEKIIDEIRRVYRLVNNTTSRMEKQLQYIEDKVNKVIELNKYKGIDTNEIKRKQKIEELENRLRELKGV